MIYEIERGLYMNRKTIRILLVICSIASFMVSFAVVTEVGDVESFNTLGMARYIWIMYLFIPIPLASVIFGFISRKNGERHKVNIIVGFICMFILICFASMNFLVNDDKTIIDDSYILSVEEKLNIELPDNMKVQTDLNYEYIITYAKINDNSTKISFEASIKNNELWKQTLSAKVKGLIPINIQVDLMGCDYYLIYNETTKSFGSGTIILQ